MRISTDAHMFEDLVLVMRRVDTHGWLGQHLLARVQSPMHVSEFEATMPRGCYHGTNSERPTSRGCFFPHSLSDRYHFKCSILLQGVCVTVKHKSVTCCSASGQTRLA